MATLSDKRRRTLQLQERAFTFTYRTLRACPTSGMDPASRALWNQLVRAAMGAAGNLEEADEASSDADFVNKMKIALREAKEARRWLRALRVCGLTGHQGVSGLEQEAGELAAIFAAIVIKVKARIRREREAQAKKSKARTLNSEL